jgi:sulfur relay (sulfurtransferase) complex TusBCD TusD component (DsrE family)
MKRKLGLLLSLPPTDANSTTVMSLAQAALEAGHEVYLYLIDEGVKNMADPRYLALAHGGAKVFVCAYGCQQHQVPTDKVDPAISLCGLVVLSGIIDACEPFLSFT